MRHRIEAFCAAGLVGGTYVMRLPLLAVRNYDPDEFQHLHSAYSIAHGLLPYRDYFEHHTPLIHLLLAPLFLLFDVETSPSRAFAFLSFARGLMWAATGAILWFTFLLARDLRGPRVAWLSTAFLSTSWLFFDKTLEIRPDVPACALLVAALRLAARGVNERSGMAFVQSGLAFGLGLLSTQKLAIVLPGLLAGMWIVGAPLLAFLAWGVACALPVVVMLAYFLLRGGLLAFLESNLLVNLRWKAGFPPDSILREELFLPNAALCAFAAFGLVLALGRLRRPQGRRRGEAIVVLSGFVGFAGLWIVPVPWQQYYLTFLPVVAILAGLGLAETCDSVASRFSSARPSPVAQVVAAMVLLLGSLQPLALFRAQFGRSNADKLASLRFVIENTATGEPVLDGYTGIGVFRPHAWRFFFLHAEMQKMLGDAERRQLLEGLRSGKIAPRLISYDGHLSRVSPEITAFFNEHYAAVGQGPIWARVFPQSTAVWGDDAVRLLRRPEAVVAEPYVLVGQGWSETEEEAGVRFRRSRGRLSNLLLPVRDPKSARLVLRARAGSRVAGLAFELLVNGSSLGSSTPGPGWAEHAFELPAGLLKRGLNRLALRYPRTPNQAEPLHGGPNAVLALESLRLEHTAP